MMKKIQTCSRIFSAVGGAAVAGSMFLMLPSARLDLPSPGAGPYDAVFEEGALCTAAREDTAALVARLPSAPVMGGLEEIKAMIASYTGPGLPPQLTQDPSDPHIYTLRYRDEEGKAHRAGAPAIIQFDSSTGRAVMEIWAQHGVFHRIGGLPASTEWDEQGRVGVMTWRENGVLQNSAGGPAYMKFDWDNDRLVKGWYRQDAPFRPDGLPSLTETVISNGRLVREEWANRTGEDRLQHRSDGLHIQEHDPVTGFQVYKRYYLHDSMAHSDEFVYEIRGNPRTGLPLREEWKKNDVLQGFVTYDENGRPTALYSDAGRIQALREQTRKLKATHPADHSGHAPGSP